MSDSSVALITAGLAAVVTVVGWNVSHYLARRREDRNRRIEAEISRIERQIEEFYGPLISLIKQIFNVWDIRKRILESVDSDKKEKIREFIYSEYFLPLHIEMRELIKSKFYLNDDEKVSEKLKEYLIHSTQEVLQKRIYRELQISTVELKGDGWPKSFSRRVEEAIEEKTSRRKSLIDNLKVEIHRK